MTNTTQTQEDFFIVADSIVVSQMGEGVQRIFLFNPTDATLDSLRSICRGQRMGRLVLVDKWDDGSDDTHTSEGIVSFIALVGSGDARKTHTYALTVIDGDFFKAVVREFEERETYKPPKPSPEIWHWPTSGERNV